MRFADARSAEEQHVFRLRQKPTGRQLSNQALIDRRLEFKSKSSSVLTDGKCAIFSAIVTRVRCFASTSSRSTRSRKSRYGGSVRAASLRTASSRSAT